MVINSASAHATRVYLAEASSPTPAGIAFEGGLGEPYITVDEFTAEPAPFAEVHMETWTTFCVVHEGRVLYTGDASQRFALHEAAKRLPGAEVREVVERIKTQVVGRKLGRALSAT